MGLGLTAEGPEGSFGGDGNVPYLDWGSGYMDLSKFIKLYN